MNNPAMAVRTLPVFLACLLPFLAAAQEPTATEMLDLGARNADFAARLYRAVASSTDDNVLLAPLTASLSLAALAGGAGGVTRQQILEGLGINTLDAQRIPDLFEYLWKSVKQSGGLSQAIGLFAGQPLGVAEGFKTVLENQYGGTAQSLDFTSNPQAAKDTINQLLQGLTADRVKDAVSAVSAQTQLMLVNAAFFQAPFALSFNASLTQDERFYVDKYRIVQVPMMFRSGKFHLAYDRSLKLGVLRLPLQGQASMLVLLPDEEVDLVSVEEEISAGRFHGWLSQLKRTKLEVQMPRFSVVQGGSLGRVMPGLGFTTLLQTPDTDLAGVTGTTGVTLSEFVHKVGVTVDESSSGAGGANDVFSSLPPRLTINRPFLFLIYHEPTRCLLLMGRVVDPTKV